ncbi:erythromycin esterase family protein [Edaphobacter sp. HDX4]|uniref:erythromycin esterase family protein n=1 Tax=Edaphobacter sp. HDX4 TaxID=2794064 RepID=UPI002FE6191B
MGGTSTNHAIEQVRRAAIPLSFNQAESDEYDPLIKAIGDARIVLIGEASHGTHEFYRERARITRRLIAELGFSAVAAEADWPDAYRLNRYLLGQTDPSWKTDNDAEEALRGFQRFPSWMWRNEDVVGFSEWLRNHNRGNRHCAGFYGLDLYSLYTSAQAVLTYLYRNDPEAARRARLRYGCFEEFEEDSQAYGYAANFGLTESCESAVIEQLLDLQRKNSEIATWHAPHDRSEAFSAEQNALLVRDAERYYRMMFERNESSWNLRDTHMADTLDALLRFLGPSARVVVWAHNSHLGDAQATQMSRRGELNLGQLVRERHGSQCFNLGFTTHTGEVTAATNWDEPAQRKRVRPSLQGSYERLFHETQLDNFLLRLRSQSSLREALSESRLERAIGVIYRPETERMSHYFLANMSNQFDAVVHIDQTHALVPLEPSEAWHGEEAASLVN